MKLRHSAALQAHEEFYVRLLQSVERRRGDQDEVKVRQGLAGLCYPDAQLQKTILKLLQSADDPHQASRQACEALRAMPLAVSSR